MVVSPFHTQKYSLGNNAFERIWSHFDMQSMNNKLTTRLHSEINISTEFQNVHNIRDPAAIAYFVRTNAVSLITIRVDSNEKKKTKLQQVLR